MAYANQGEEVQLIINDVSDLNGDLAPGCRKSRTARKIAYGPARLELQQILVADKISEVNEHSDSEFYYPDDLSF